MSYVDRLRSEHRAAEGASRNAPKAATVRVVYAIGLLRMPFQEF